MTIRDAVRWFQAHLGFINRLPSWLNELLSGLLCVAIAYGLLVGWTGLLSLVAPNSDLRAATFPFAFVLSEFYERTMDPWGYNAQDVVERNRGIVLIMIAVTVRGMP